MSEKEIYDDIICNHKIIYKYNNGIFIKQKLAYLFLMVSFIFSVIIFLTFTLLEILGGI